MSSTPRPFRPGPGRTQEFEVPAVAEAWPRLLVVGSFLPGFQLGRYVGGDLAVEISKRGGTVITTSPKRSTPLRLADMLHTILARRRDYDLALVTVFSGRAFIYAECAAALLSFLGKRNVLALHGGNLPGFAARWPGRTRRLLDRASLVVCPSGYLRENLKGLRPDLHLIPNAIDVARYPLQLPRQRGVRLIWLRAFHHIYNPMMAPAVLARLLETLPQAQLTMVGSDKDDGSHEATRRTAAELGVLDRISFAGPIPKESVARVIGEHDIFLNTTNFDNTPVSVIEALACGLPVVSTNVGGIPYLLEHEKTALLVEPGNVEGMAAAVKRLVTAPDLASQLSANGRQLVESFDWKVVLPQWLELFTQLQLMPDRIIAQRERSGAVAANRVDRK